MGMRYGAPASGLETHAEGMQIFGELPEPLQAAPVPQSASWLQSFVQKSPNAPMV
jgi:hypothetical protein